MPLPQHGHFVGIRTATNTFPQHLSTFLQPDWRMTLLEAHLLQPNTNIMATVNTFHNEYVTLLKDGVACYGEKCHRVLRLLFCRILSTLILVSVAIPQIGEQYVINNCIMQFWQREIFHRDHNLYESPKLNTRR